MRRRRPDHSSAIQIASEQVADGSVVDTAKRNNTSIVDAAMGCDVLMLIDTSGSMTMRLMTGDTAHQRAANELAKIQAEFKGKVAVFAFSSDVMFCPTGTPIKFNGGTDMVKALEHVLRFDGILKIYLTSDGFPDNSHATLLVAKRFKSPIHTIFIGDENDMRPQRFLQELAAATGGKYVKADKIAQLYGPTKRLMLADGVTQ